MRFFSDVRPWERRREHVVAQDTVRKEILFLKPPLLYKTKEEEKEEEDYYNHIILHI